MSTNPYLDSVIKYLKDKKFSEIINLKPNEINKFIRENKSDIISSLNLSEIKNSSESIEIDETINIEKVNLINKELTDRLAVLQENFNQVSLKNQNLLNEKESFLAEIDRLNKDIDKYKNKAENQKVENLISMKLNTFNSLLNNNSPERQITIKDFILVNISKFIDKHNLIKTENLISQNRDLYSEMVQICLLSFMHENLLF
ncbi:hypothetical protein [Clostridium perfringens]|uniref:Uncharacterized protein n=1 Tax=Clostridium perfringens TaxID=1502 RepID=A0A133NBU3_CLOPF|nr:hypothetical protein [Clostridium perfringens]EGT3601008.1 hypothetical protein [Clostridium perfringens]EIF6174391.1 hypothetical protein [Clostridium perfringens]KXA13758.1 hypothetical protein HMPREF3222_00758 [Clostridium perfringens]